MSLFALFIHQEWKVWGGDVGLYIDKIDIFKYNV